MLDIGCGNSRVAEDMVMDGYFDILSIDFSRIVIDQMEDRYKEDNLGDDVRFVQVR